MDSAEATSRATSFEAVTGPRTQDVPGGQLLIIAYGVLWVLVFGYVFRLIRLERRLRHDIESMRKS